MNLFRSGRDSKDLARLREVVTILVKQGFHDVLRNVKLAHHAKLSAHLAKTRETTPERVRETLKLLGPTFVKLGQVLSLRSDLIPPDYCEEFKKLQDDVAPLPFAVVKGVTESELKRPLTAIFRKIDERPIAVTSVAQVHKAILKDGKDVVVKVQRPGVRDAMARDIDIMAYIARRVSRTYPALHAAEIVDEFRRYTRNELDLRFELRNIKRFREVFVHDPAVIIPKPYEILSTQNILVMERLKGTRLNDKAALERQGFDLKRLARICLRAMLKQVFSYGFFHGDPHFENLLALRKGGKEALGILDFSIVGFIDDDTRRRFLELLDALFRKDVRGVVHVLLRIGTCLPDCNPDALEHALSPIVLAYHDASFHEGRWALLVDKLIGTVVVNSVKMPASVILVAKAFIMMEDAASRLDPSLNLTREATPLLKSSLRKSYAQARLKEEALRDARELHDLARDLPVAANTIMTKIKEGKVVLALDGNEFRRAEQEYDLEA